MRELWCLSTGFWICLIYLMGSIYDGELVLLSRGILVLGLVSPSKLARLESRFLLVFCMGKIANMKHMYIQLCACASRHTQTHAKNGRQFFIISAVVFRLRNKSTILYFIYDHKSWRCIKLWWYLIITGDAYK